MFTKKGFVSINIAECGICSKTDTKMKTLNLFFGDKFYEQFNKKQLQQEKY